MTTERFLQFFVTLLAASAAFAGGTKPFTVDYARPLSFEANRGQTDGQVDFVARGPGYNLFLSHGNAIIAFRDHTTIGMQLVHANASLPDALGDQLSKSNYFIGNEPEKWQANIANYARVRYRDVYAGVDLIYYGNQRQVEYDFVVAPGVDAGKIALEFQGVSKAVLDRSGELVVHTATGEIRWHKPIAYQEIDGTRRRVGCDYAGRGEQLRFKLADYDRGKALIIDPVLDYSTYLGDDGTDLVAGVAVDRDGNAMLRAPQTRLTSQPP